jgi:2,4-dienoyl-CoA reductase-like NADH-dependent reductase (Old Yellow Enzyme family)
MSMISKLPVVKDFQHILAPLELRGQSIKNRLFFAPMGLDLAHRDGRFSPELFEFYSGIIDGGCGFLILSNASVTPDSILQPNGLRLYHADQAQSMASIVEAGRAANALVGLQLQHYGGQAVTTYTRGQAMLTPSAVASAMLKKKDSRYRVRAMTLEDIEIVKNQFAESARLAELSGAKLIQLQASNGYLLSSFQSPATNLRTDQYGGDAVSRGRFLLEVIRSIRAKISPNILLSIRLGIDDYLDGIGTVANDFKDLIPMYEEAGIDMIETSICVAETFSRLTGDAPDVSAKLQSSTKTIKGYSKVPVGFAGLVRSLEQAEEIIANGVADFVGMARALFADNDLIIKTLDGRRDEIHWCLWDGNCFKDKHNPRFNRVYCCVNPKYLRPQ